MAIAENEKAAEWLIKEVFSKINVPFIVAGNGISASLKKIATKHASVSFIADPSIIELQELIAEAHVNVLPSLNNTGVKLKVLNALFRGRFCITNTPGIAGSNIDADIQIANEPVEYIESINSLMCKEFTPGEMGQRQPLIEQYNNASNAKKLSALLYSHYQ
jgi:glycosyltransferase involved in cell wall biosynthesis